MAKSPTRGPPKNNGTPPDTIARMRKPTRIVKRVKSRTIPPAHLHFLLWLANVTETLTAPQGLRCKTAAAPISYLFPAIDLYRLLPCIAHALGWAAPQGVRPAWPMPLYFRLVPEACRVLSAL